MKNLKENKPTADVLMTSMRAMGYSFESAIADIIDNSISANAKNIQLYFPIDPVDCYVVICDDPEQTVDTIQQIFSAERMKRVRQIGLNEFAQKLMDEALHG